MIDERRVALAKMTSPEAAEALAGAEVALIPVGATEQHGPTSMGLALQPDIVHGEALEAGKIRSTSLPYSNVMESPRVGVPLAFEEITENGALGDARQASEEFGQELTNAIVRRTVVFLERFLSQ